MLTVILLPVVFALLSVEYLRRNKYKAPKGLKLPPGPPGKPFVGNFFEYHKVFQPSSTKEWKGQYGDIVSINLFGVPVIFIYSDEIAQELFEKRGVLYSGRYPFHMAWLMGWEFDFVFFKYGDWWRRHIREFHQFFNSRAVLSYEPVQMRERRRLLQNLLDTPEDFNEHIKFSVGRVIMDVIYAIDIKTAEGDTFMSAVHTSLEGIGYAMVPGLWVVDSLPIFKHIPDWLPGVKFKKIAKKYREATYDAIDIPFDIAKNRECPDYSFVSSSLERLNRLQDPPPDGETIIKNVASTAYTAGAGTTYAALLQAVVASILYPETQEKMHDELDRVLGDRLPTLEDRKDLPYVNAFCYEVLRWRPSAPLAVPHSVLEDDVYGDFFIPKGAMIIGNSWHIMRNKKYGPNPEDFNPERFFQPGIPLPTEHFGFGRRACPGRFFAENTFFLFLASIFKVFDITHKKDENGNDILVSDRTLESSLPLPEPFQCSLTPRSALSTKLIMMDNVD